jgi:hypothetical protein
MNREIPSDQPDTMTPENVAAAHKGHGEDIWRIQIRHTGLTICGAETGNRRIEDVLARFATIIWDEDAEGPGTAGTDDAPLKEIAYEIDGDRWYCYVLYSAATESEPFVQNCWTTQRRLTASAAFDTIMRARGGNPPPW